MNLRVAQEMTTLSNDSIVAIKVFANMAQEWTKLGPSIAQDMAQA